MLRKISIWLGGALVLSVAAILTSSLTSLDWERQHSQETAALPLFSTEAEGLVRIQHGASSFGHEWQDSRAMGPA